MLWALETDASSETVRVSVRTQKEVTSGTRYEVRGRSGGRRKVGCNGRMGARRYEVRGHEVKCTHTLALESIERSERQTDLMSSCGFQSL